MGSALGLAAALLGACSGSGMSMTETSLYKPAPPPRSDAWEDDAPEVDAAERDACSGLSRTACMKSAECTLEVAAPGERTGDYVCRRAQDRCEEGIVQFDLPGGGASIGTQALADEAILACTSREGCVYTASECYCACKGYGRTSVEDGAEAQGCLCYCASGPPPSCVARG